MSLKINGSRVREARLFKGFTITELSKKIGVSKQMLSKYEHNKSNISIETLQKIASELKFPIPFFTNFDNVHYINYGTFYRSRLTATQSSKRPIDFYKKATAFLLDYFEQYIDFPTLEHYDFSNYSPQEAAAELRKIWKLGNGPIQDILTLMETHGIVTANVKLNECSKVDANGGLIEVNGNDYYIVIDNVSESNFYRQQFSLAHELGHYMLHVFDGYCLDDLDGDEYRTMEKEANQFASSFLLPPSSFKDSLKGKDLTNILSFVPLKSVWNTSIASMIHRAHELKIIDSQTYEKLQKSKSYRGWNKEEINDHDKPLLKPTVLNTAFALLEEHMGITPSTLSSYVNNSHGYYYPNEVLSQILDIDMSRFKGNIINLKMK